MSSRLPAPLMCVAASKPPIQNESNTCGRAGARSCTMRKDFLTRLTGDDFGIQRERLSHDLIHVVVLVCRQPADEIDALGCRRQHLVLPVELGVLASRNWIV